MIQHLQKHSDTLTGIVATTAVPAPLWTGWLDGTAKLAALAYSVLGIVWLIKQIFKPSKGEN